jgi:hypothetical protein
MLLAGCGAFPEDCDQSFHREQAAYLTPCSEDELSIDGCGDLYTAWCKGIPYSCRITWTSESSGNVQCVGP